MKLLSLNIEGDNHLDVVIPFVQKESPDVVCFNEVFESDVPLLKHALNMQGVFVPTVTLQVPNSFRLKTRGNMGALILSSGAILRTQIDYYQGDPGVIPELTDKNNNAANRVLLWADVSVGDQEYTVVTTHFTITHEGTVTPLQRENLAKVMQLLSKHAEFVLCGDFNAPRGREIFDTLASHYKDNIPFTVKTTLDASLHRSKNLPEFVVDGLFTTRHMRVRDVRVVSGVSDHCAIIATVTKEEV